ncbi:hypothetical protein EKO27_g4628 [Xylaria grammica]|uniref:Uncharacterized protein n=1 Tax=Xylaria grammica TaxID=363999 RepID=A0A439D7S7_9PEZI|nr:hypothetical protein EKO27_g4628 [Xylaria grammica]
MRAMKKPSKLGNFDLRFPVYICGGIIILFYVLALTGCVSNSPGVSNIYLVKVQSRLDNTTEVRVGYFGICLTERGRLECVSSYERGTNTVAKDLSNKGVSVPGNAGSLISLALTIQTKIFPPLLAAAGVFFFLGGVALTMLKRSFKKVVAKKPSSSKQLRVATLLLGGAAIVFATASAVATTETTNALGFATSNSTIGSENIRFSAGLALQVLQWFIVGLSLIFQVSIESMFLLPGKVLDVAVLPQQNSGAFQREPMGFNNAFRPPSAQGGPGSPGFNPDEERGFGNQGF